MHDDDITRALAQLTSSGRPPEHRDLLRAVRRRRARRRVAAGSGVLAVGVVATTAVLGGGMLRDDSPLVARDGETAGSPSSTASPTTADPTEPRCGRGREVAFSVNSDPQGDPASRAAIRGPEPAEVVARWLRPGQRSRLVRTEAKAAEVQVVDESGKSLAFVELSPVQGSATWAIIRNVVCMDPDPSASGGCGFRVDGPQGVRYRMPTPPAEYVLGPAGWIGQGRMPACARWSGEGGTRLAPRESIAPVTLFNESEMPAAESAVVVVDDQPTLLVSQR